MDGISTSWAAKILNAFTGQAITPPGTAGTVYLGLSTNEPSIDGTGFTEPDSASGYVRQEILVDTSAWSTPASRLIQNLNNIIFPDVTTTDWEQIVSVGIFEAATGGVPIAFCGINMPRIIKVGNGAYIPAGAGKFRMSKVSGTTTGLEYANALLNVFRGVSPQILTHVWLAVGSSIPSVTNDVVNIGELSSSLGYERVKIEANSTNFGITSPRTLKNLKEIRFVKEASLPLLDSQADSDWPVLKSFALYNTANGTSPLYFGLLQKDAVVYAEDILRVAPQKLVVTL